MRSDIRSTLLFLLILAASAVWTWWMAGQQNLAVKAAMYDAFKPQIDMLTCPGYIRPVVFCPVPRTD